jgi:hypothetical protein
VRLDWAAARWRYPNSKRPRRMPEPFLVSEDG